jgi:eukaryotic-like serine/threonine-protein kinase
MTPCLEDERLLDLAEGRRAIDPASQAHLAACSECRRIFAAVARGAGATLDDAGAAPDDEPAWDELGQGVTVASRYVLEAFLGAGGMSVVWRAQRKDDGARVALKLARAGSPELWHRFEREAKVAGALAHPNIVRTLDVVPATASRGPVLVLELLEGETLEAHLARSPALSLGQASRIVLAIASALGAAHARGVVHRDLKPQNIFLSGPRVVVLDFGIAKLTPAFGAHSKITRPGTVLGSPRYMAPEQVFGEEPIDERADVWALASVLVRMLTGRAPVEGESLGEIMRTLRAGRVADLGQLAPQLPADVIALARHALAIERGARFRDVGRFEAVLGRYRAM